MVKNMPDNAGNAGDVSSITRSGNGTPLQYSCLGNPMDRGPWWVEVPRVAKGLA